jgi:ATP-dependent Clp protease ATP-binding subunit ClpB
MYNLLTFIVMLLSTLRTTQGFRLHNRFPLLGSLHRTSVTRLLSSSSGGDNSPFGKDGGINPSAFSGKGWEAVNKATEYVSKHKQPSFEAPHLLKALMDDGPNGITQRIMKQVGITPADVDSKLKEFFQKQPKPSSFDPTSVMMGSSAIEAISKAEKFRDSYGDNQINPEHLFLGAVEVDGAAKKAIIDAGASLDAIKLGITSLLGKTRNVMAVDAGNGKKIELDALTKYGRDLTAAAEAGKLDPVIGRDDEIRRTIQILSRRTKNNPILLGEPGKMPFLLISCLVTDHFIPLYSFRSFSIV